MLPERGLRFMRVWPKGPASSLDPVVTDGLHRAAFQRLHALLGFLFILRLLVNVGVALVIGAFEVVGSSFTTEVAVNALAVDIEFSVDAFFVLVFAVGHGGRGCFALDARAESIMQPESLQDLAFRAKHDSRW